MQRLEADRRIGVENSYYHQGLAGSLPGLYIRTAVKNRLFRVLDKLPRDYSFRIFDGFRPLETQGAIFDVFLEKFKEKGLSEELAWKKTREMVSHPKDKDRYQVMPHNSGGAIDLTLCLNQGPLDMGTGFDDTSRLSATDFFEKAFDPSCGISEKRWILIRQNRRLLFNAMISEGFTNHPLEWWHYNYGNQPWADELGTDAIFDSAESQVRELAGINQAAIPNT